MKMKSRRSGRWCSVMMLSSWLVAAAGLRAQITVSGISDNTIYNDWATFTVQTQAGYDYGALLDSAPAPVGTAVTVRQVDYHELRVFATNQNTLAVTSQLIQFIVRDSARGT